MFNERLQQRWDAIKQARVLADIPGIEFKEALAQPLELTAYGNPEAKFDQCGRPVRHLGADGGEGHDGFAFLGQQRIQRLRQIGRGIGQRSVEIKQNRANSRSHIR